ncbi:MAG: hypothetical protein ACLPYS_01720 [Vulcanimicrobiaceae bacterium]
MADIAPMLGAILGISKSPKGEDKKRAVKPKTKKGRGDHKVTKGEGSVTSPAQQHGELASYQVPKPISDRKLMRENAKHTLRRATDDWVEGRITTHEHKAVHERAKHVLSGKNPHEFKGPSGERSFKKMQIK